MALNYVSGPASAVVDNTIVRWDSTTGRLVQGSTVSVSDNGDLVQPNTATLGHRLYNTADQTTNTEYVELVWSANIARLRQGATGSGTARSLILGSSGGTLNLGPFGSGIVLASTLGGSAGPGLDITNTATSFSATSGAQSGVRITGTVNQASGTASWDSLLINPTLTAVGSGGANLVRAQVASADRWACDSNGSTSACMGTAIPAGGTTGRGVKVSSTANFGMFFGSGAPSLTAAKGSLYLRSDGSGVADRCYVNTDGGTTWTALATLA